MARALRDTARLRGAPRVFGHRPSGEPITDVELADMLVAGDPDALSFLEDIVGAACRAVGARVRPRLDHPMDSLRSTK